MQGIDDPIRILYSLLPNSYVYGIRYFITGGMLRSKEPHRGILKISHLVHTAIWKQKKYVHGVVYTSHDLSRVDVSNVSKGGNIKLCMFVFISRRCLL